MRRTRIEKLTSAKNAFWVFFLIFVRVVVHRVCRHDRSPEGLRHITLV
jgi:hypothetical protein